MVLTWVRGYQREWLARDLVGGLSAGAVVIPQAMAYATIAGLPVQVGLYTCMVPTLAYVVLGGSRTLSVSTTSTVAVLTGSALLAADLAENGSDPVQDLATLTVLVGLLLLGARLLRIGSMIDAVSEATLTGIKVGVGLTVAADQLPKLLGIPGDPDATGFFSVVGGVIDDLGDASLVTLAFSAVSVVAYYALRKVVPRVPGPLVLAVGGIVAVAAFSLDEHGLATIGEVPSGLPLPVRPSPDRAGDLLPGALAIAVMVFLESVTVARQVRRRSEPEIDPGQELVANGVACVAGGLFRAMPPAGGFSQTAVNQRAGARTQLSEVVTALLAVGCALFLGGILADVPQATLGSLVLVAVLSLIEPREIVRFWRLDRTEFWVVVVTAGAGLVWGLLVAVAVGVVLTLYLVLHSLGRVGATELQPTAAGDDIRPVDDGTVPVAGLLVLRVNGPLYAASVHAANERMLAALDGRPGTDVLVVDITSVDRLTVSVIDAAPDLQRAIRDRGAELWLSGLSPTALLAARQVPLWQELDAVGRIHPTALAAVRAYRDRQAGG